MTLITSIATALVWATIAYAAVGFVFACVFVIFVVDNYDSSAKDAPKGFRILILPGVAALWPVFAVRLLRKNPSHPTEHSPHRVP